FVLNFLGYDLSIVEEEIHEIDHKYDYCFENHQDESCEGVVAKIKSQQYSNTFTVMAPYEDAVGLGFSEDFEEVFLYDTESKMLAEITKWWIDGKISDYYFTKSIEILTGSSKNIVQSNDALLKKPDWLLIAEPPKNIALAEKQDLSEKSNEIMQTFPFINPKTDDTKEIKIPDWFKSKSQSWVQDKIDDEEFFAGIEQFLYSEDASTFVENNDVAVEDIVEEAMLLIDSGEYYQALALFDRALWDSLENETLSVDAMTGKGIALFLLGNHQESLIYFDSVLELDPQNYEATKKKAQVLAQLGQFDDAKEYFEKSFLLLS
ncbi:MAG: tetratricopeptide repeat protein, partial [Nitrosopumilus sp.]|nr:tetratricopeptide repeat protein [Nitrosopumilus sp.]NNL52485.1 tetratricopeptide repeat protein [Nitrosopumilus sp.]